jgi:urease accessory protein
MSEVIFARTLHRKGQWQGPAALSATLDYDGRFLRRKRVTCDDGTGFIIDLAQTQSLDEGDALALEDGRLVEIRAAAEQVYAVRGDLARLAWHIGNRHTPCQIDAGVLFIMRDPVIGHMLEHLGAKLELLVAPFTPEGGAYGHGRTHSHEHVATTHDHSHLNAHDHSASHDDAHDHAHDHHAHDHSS